jgi:seryl-tRNA synthetase
MWIMATHFFAIEYNTCMWPLGSWNRGLYRVHQFSKVEMFALSTPDQSEAVFDELVDIQCELFSELGLHCRVLEIPTGDLGAPAYRKIDIEAYMPGRDDYGEISSTSNCTDYQSRRMCIRYRSSADGKSTFGHTLNGTACAIPRILLSLLEQGQQVDGSIKLPDVLKPFMMGITSIPSPTIRFRDTK